MKYRILSLGILLFAATAIHGQTRVGITGGVHLAHISSNDADINDEKQAMAGFQLGLLTDIPLGTGGWSFQPRLMVQTKGTGLSHGDHSDKLRFTALDLPLSLQYRTKGGFFVGAGPNIGFNLAAVVKGHDEKETLELGSEAGQLNRTDLGMDIRSGFQLKSGLTLGLNYVRGFSNIQNTSGVKWNNHLFGFQVAYFFGAKGK
jgi:Outer membrane protein beta-barrel domain